MSLRAPLRLLLETAETPLSRVDARVKLLLASWWCVLIATVPPGETVALVRLLLSVGLLVGFGRVPLRFLLLRMIPLIPFVLATCFIPFVQTGPPVASLGPLRVSGPGITRALETLLRMLGAGLTLSLLSACTSPPDLLQALRNLRTPERLVRSLEQLFRYLFVLLEEGSRMGQAYRARGGDWSPASLARQSFGTLLALLFLRAHDRAERVAQARRARGVEEWAPVEPAPTLPTGQWMGGLLLALLGFLLRLGISPSTWPLRAGGGAG